MTQLDNASIFATGGKGETQPDSITIGGGSIWAEYGNGANTTGKGGSSTIVRYSMSGKVEHTFTIKGSVDGLKVDPSTGTVFALQNQDGNSTMSLIDPATNKVSGPLTYAVTSATRGYDDIAFDNGAVYLSYTNPTGSGDPVLQRLTNGDMPLGTLVTTNILSDGATGTNIATGQTNQAIPLNDSDSLKSLADGRLVLTSGADNSFTLISNPGTAAQIERFVQLKNLPTGSALDDVVVPTSSSGTFYVANAGTNQIQAFKVSGLNTSDAYASVGTEIVQVDLQTGAQTPLITGLSGSHGLTFVPSVVQTPTVRSTTIFATGSEAAGKAPDSVTMGANSIWVEYGNGADSTGKLPNGGSSTIVQYSMLGQIEHSYTIPGSVDGLKYDPASGLVFALKNQDANSKLYTIDPQTNTVSGPMSYAAPYVSGAASSRGYDDVAFDHGKVYLSYTNPTNVGDPVVQQLDNGNDPSGSLKTTTILRLGDTGTNMVTGQVNQPLPVADPDSLKTLSNGSLILTSDHDASLTIINHPGTAQQSASFVNLPAGASGLDDAIMPTSTSGTFYISNGGGNDVLKVDVTGLNTKDIYLSVGSDNAVDQLDPTTGALTPVITGLNAPAGLMFIPAADTKSTLTASTINLNHEAASLGSSTLSMPAATTSTHAGGTYAMSEQSTLSGSHSSLVPTPANAPAVALTHHG
jgi:hypothetical protein